MGSAEGCGSISFWCALDSRSLQVQGLHFGSLEVPGEIKQPDPPGHFCGADVRLWDSSRSC